MTKHLFHIVWFSCAILFSLEGEAQEKRALFLGNSYTFYNALPQLTAELASSVGETLIVDSNTPGGYTLEGHSTNATSISKIQEGNWDFVVLQEQSQRPSFPIAQVETDVFPYAQDLNDAILESNECAETVFYMTWGRENGDASNCANWPPVCTYEGMDDLLHERYVQMAEMNEAVVSPVGAVWRYIRENHPEINLYDTDGSHPSPEGSYAAACSFYTVFYRSSPVEITNNNGLSDEIATILKNAAKVVVFEQLSTWFVGEYDITADFTTEQEEGLTYQFISAYTGNDVDHFWDFGNGTSDEANPIHTFPAESEFNVTHIVTSNCDSDEVTIPITATTSIEELDFHTIVAYPNPSNGNIQFSSPFKNAQIHIFDLQGKLVASFENFNGNALDLTNLEVGSYALNIAERGDDIATYTIRIQR